MSNPASNLAERAQSGRPISVLSGRGSQMGRRTPTAWTTADENVPDGSVRDLEAFERDDVQFANNAQADVVPEPERSGCWHSFTRGIRGLWSTRQMKKGIEDREWIVRTTLRELLVYTVFLTILCVLTFGMASPNMYYQTKVLSELFLDTTFPSGTSVKTATQMNDFWGFAQTAMVDGLYWEHWYNSNVTTPDDRNILFENRLLGSPRLRQLRVLNDSCKVHEDFKKAIAQCYNHYSPHIEDPSPFGLMNGSAWFYHTEKQMNGSNHWGLLASYSGAGSFMDLGITKAVAKERVKELYDNLWVSRATRAVFLDFTTYNANLNLFCIVKILFEFPATGGMLTSWTFRTVKLIRYVTTMDFFVMGCEGLFVLFIFYYCIEEAIEIKNNKCSYFKSVWNILDITVIFISLICICFSVYRTMMVDSLLRGLLENPDIFADFEFLGFWQTQFNNMVAIAVFFAWVKIFKYISFNKTMTQLSSTLSRCSKDVAGFAVMFFIVFFAFAQLGYLLFGTQINDYRSFTRTIFTLLRLILGDFSFTDLEAANRVLGPLYFLSFVFFVFFVLMNMFLAIINDTYAEVKEEIANQKNEFEIADYFKKGYNNILTKLGKRDHLKNMENALKMADSDGDKKLSYDEVRKKLKEQNFSDMEIDMVFAKYDLDGNLELDEGEMQQMFSDLEGERNKLDWEIKKDGTGQFERPDSVAEEHHSGVSLDDFNVLSRRVDRMEHSIGSIVSKIDAVLVKMEAMERAKTKRRDNMNKILDSVNQNNGLDDKGKRQEMEKRVREELQRWDSEASLSSPTTHMNLPHSGT